MNDPSQPERDESELRLLATALDHGLPVLGVCRGMQLMALAYGGRLVQHLPDVLATEVHQQQAGAFRHHDVHVLPGTLLADVYGAGRREVSTHHHQGVAKPGSLTVAARAVDSVIEAVEDRQRPFVLGVQWHPEVLDDGQLFAGSPLTTRGASCRRCPWLPLPWPRDRLAPHLVRTPDLAGPAR